MSAARVAALLGGALLVLATFHGLLVTLVVPRRSPRLRRATPREEARGVTGARSGAPASGRPRPRRIAGRGRIASSRLASLIWHLARLSLGLLSRLACFARRQQAVELSDLAPQEAERVVRARLERFLREDRVLGLLGPLSLLCLFGVWLALLLLGYSLLTLGVGGGSFGSAVRLTGSSLLTLGVSAPRRASTTALSYLAATSGLIALALEIGYLPTIHGHYNRRETLVRVLESRAGEPAWGPEILARHANNGSLDALADLYARWEAWAADVVEAHLTFPWLMLFRSSEPLQSWITSLLAVLDSAAIYLAACPTSAPNAQARQCLRMGFTALQRLADALGVEYDADPLPTAQITLKEREFQQAIAHLERNRFPLERPAEDAWPDFKGWRVNYEQIAYRLIHLLRAPPALWSGAPEPIPPFTPRHRRPDDVEGENLVPLLAHGRPFGRAEVNPKRIEPMGRTPLVSVLTAAFAPEDDYLLAAYRSLCEQDEVAWEWLIQIDGAHAVLPRELLADERVLAQANGRHLGVGATRNRGMLRARAEFVQNLDADDQLLPGALAAGVAALEGDPALAFAFGRTVHLLPDGSKQTPWRGRVPFAAGRVEAGALPRFWLGAGEDPLPISPIMWRKTFAYAYGGWSALSVLEDTALVYAVSSQHPCFYLDRDTQLYRVHRRQATLAADYRRQRAPSRRFIFERLCALQRLEHGTAPIAAQLPPDPAERPPERAPDPSGQLDERAPDG